MQIVFETLMNFVLLNQFKSNANATLNEQKQCEFNFGITTQFHTLI